MQSFNNQNKITTLLHKAGDGDTNARDRLIEALYQELKTIAVKLGARSGDTLSPTVLVHDAFLRLMNYNGDFSDRFHFFKMATVTIRRLIIDHLREKSSEKRGKSYQILPLIDNDVSESSNHDWLLIMEALQQLEKTSPEKRMIIELRFWCGLSVEEIAQGLNLSTKTVYKRLHAAKSWLLFYFRRRRHLKTQQPDQNET